jgi:hypothetical protein
MNAYRGLVFKILFCYSIVITVYFFKITDNSNLKHEFLSVKECISDKHSVCFINKRFCHPGYTGENCDTKLIPANPWYTSNCPNLNKEITYDIKTPLSDLSNGQDCNLDIISGVTGCAHLCTKTKINI